MRQLMILAVASGFVLGLAGESRAQASSLIAIASTGQGLSIGTPPGFSFGYPNYSSYGTMGSGFSGASVGSYGYSRGYGGVTASSYLAGPGLPTYGGTGYGYAGRPPIVGSYGYSSYASPVASYGYVARPRYGYGYAPAGFRPFRGLGLGRSYR